MSVHILGVRIDTYSKEEALKRVSNFLSQNGQFTVYTPNPEMVVAAYGQRDFLHILNSGSLNICDGTGLFFALKRYGERIAGVDFMLDVCNLALKNQKRIYLLGSGDSNVLYKTKRRLEAQFSGITIVGSHPGPKINVVRVSDQLHISVDQPENDLVIDDIIASAPDILFVGFGHFKQECWIDTYMPELPSVKIAMGVGGSYDIISGKILRAPKVFRAFGLEWLWRLLRQPWRIKRVFIATIVFPILCFFSRKK